MFKKILLATATLALLGGCASTTEPLNTKPIPYDDTKSLAFNVAKQGDFHYKLKDVDIPEDAVVRERSVLGHLASTFILSPNFFGSFGLSVTSQDAQGADHPQLLLSIKKPATTKNIDEYIAKHIFSEVKKFDPTSRFTDIEYDGGGIVEYNHHGELCVKYFKDFQTDIKSRGFQRIIDSGKCSTKMIISIIGPSNTKLFKDSQGETTIRLTFKGQGMARQYFQAFDNSYLFSPAPKYGKPKKTFPMHIQHQGNLHFFVNTSANLSPTKLENSVIYEYKKMGSLNK